MQHQQRHAQQSRDAPASCSGRRLILVSAAAAPAAAAATAAQSLKGLDLLPLINLQVEFLCRDPAACTTVHLA